MTKNIQGEALERMKKLLDPRSSSLDPKPRWNTDPRAMIEEPEEPEFDLFGNYDDYDLLNEKDDV